MSTVTGYASVMALESDIPPMPALVQRKDLTIRHPSWASFLKNELFIVFEHALRNIDFNRRRALQPDEVQQLVGNFERYMMHRETSDCCCVYGHNSYCFQEESNRNKLKLVLQLLDAIHHPTGIKSWDNMTMDYFFESIRQLQLATMERFKLNPVDELTTKLIRYEQEEDDKEEEEEEERRHQQQQN